MAEQFSIPTAGDLIAGKYLIQEELGRGAYGVVFRARQKGIERDVALKTLLPQAFLLQDVVERFHREARLISGLQHPNIVTLFDYGQSDGVLYIAMELLHGRSLKSLIDDDAPVGPKRATHIIKQLCGALDAAHKQGIIHRDLKPENIVLTTYQEDQDFVKVLDFGIAKIQGTNSADDTLRALTIKGDVLGTPHYMSPENITGGPVTEASDVYAVGILLYELLTGTHPFDAPTPSAVLVRHIQDPVPPLPDPDLENSPLGTAIQCALAKNPAHRLASARELIDVLEGEFEVEFIEDVSFLEDDDDYPTGTPQPVTAMPAATTPDRKVFALGASVIVLLMALITLITYNVLTHTGTTTQPATDVVREEPAVKEAVFYDYEPEALGSEEAPTNENPTQDNANGN